MTDIGFITSATLLDKVKDVDDQISWDRLYELYHPLIIGFCRQKGCRDEMAYDVLQECMVTLMRVLPDFHYSPEKGNFRSFLLKIVERRIQDAFRRDKHHRKAFPATKTGFFNQLEDPNVDNSNQEWDKLWDYRLLKIALGTVKMKINSVTFQSFEMYVLKKKDAEEVARELKLNKNTVFQHKNRVIKLLQQEINRLKKELGE